jgi:hypothetical protein
MTTEPRSSRATTGLRAGVSAMLIGAVLVGVGALTTTSASDQPSCPSGTAAIARYDVVDGVYVAGTGGDKVSVVDGTATGGAWTSTQLVSAIVVKGGPGSATTTIDPSQLAGTFGNSKLTPVDGVVPAVLSVQFCGADAPVAALAAPGPKPYTVTLAARTCPTYTDIIANRNRNNIQESLEDLGPDTNYTGGEVVNPAKEAAAPQDNCSPLTGWNFQWGTGITGKSPSTANLSTVTGQNSIATTTASVPELDASGNDTGRTIEGAVIYPLTDAQITQAGNGSLWIQGGTKAAALGDGSLSFGALRCATDNYNGDNVEYVRYPNGSRNVFCYAYYVDEPPEPVSIKVVKQLTERSPGGTTFEFTGDTSFIPGGTFTLRPERSGGSAEITFVRAADVAWTVGETVPTGWTLESLECTAPQSGREVTVEGSQFVANLAEGDSIVCTFTNDLPPTPTSTTSSSTTSSSTTTSSTTSSTTTSTTSTTSTTEPPSTTTTEAPPTTASPTTAAPTTAAPTTAAVTSTTASPEVGGEVVIRTEVTPDDAAANTPGALAFTGGSSTPVLVLGIVLLIAGATLSAVSWQRRRTA